MIGRWAYSPQPEMNLNSVFRVLANCLKFNPAHGKDGRFTTTDIGGISEWLPASTQNVASDVSARAYDEIFASQIEYTSTLDESVKESVFRYQQQGAEQLNNKLRGHRSSEVGQLSNKELSNIQKDLDITISNTALPNATRVYRGVNLELDGKSGDIISDKGYWSTSLSRKGAEQFLGVGGNKATVMEISLPAKHKGLLTDAVGGAGEAEVLLQRGLKFKITAVRETSATVEKYGKPRKLAVKVLEMEPV